LTSLKIAPIGTGLATVLRLTGLRSLTFNERGSSDYIGGWGGLSALQRLTMLNLEYQYMSNEDLCFLPALPSLASLSITCCTELGFDCLKWLKDCTALTELRARYNDWFGLKGLSYLHDAGVFKFLSKLDVYDSLYWDIPYGKKRMYADYFGRSGQEGYIYKLGYHLNDHMDEEWSLLSDTARVFGKILACPNLRMTDLIVSYGPYSFIKVALGLYDSEKPPIEDDEEEYMHLATGHDGEDIYIHPRPFLPRPPTELGGPVGVFKLRDR
jgi:hypothetical protein